MGGLKLSPIVKAILADADEPLDWDNDQSQLYLGVLLNKGTKKFYLDEKNNNAFIIYARGLSIIWVDDARYWTWTTVIQPGFNTIEVAELLRVSWFHISGKIKVSNISPGYRYEIVFEVLIKNGATGWHLPVNLKLEAPNQSTQEHQQSFETLPREEWSEIVVGTFTLSEADICAGGEVEFSMFEHGGHTKTGLLAKSAIVRPKQLC